MNLTLTTQWTHINNRNYLVVTVAAPEATRSTATDTYLDIQMPEGSRIRHIGPLNTDGRGRNIGVDLPDLASSDQQHIVFRVKSRVETDVDITPELHLHWIDSATGDLMERHQTGTPMPTDSTEADDSLAQIVATARAEHKQTRREHRRRHSVKENQFMNTETRKRHYRDGHRCHHRRHSEKPGHRAFGARAGRHTRKAFAGMRHEHHREPHFAGPHIIREMRMQIYELERRVRRMQRRAQIERMGPEPQVTRRPRRRAESGFIPSRSHAGRRMHAEGRKMGRMMRRAWLEREERHQGM